MSSQVASPVNIVTPKMDTTTTSVTASPEAVQVETVKKMKSIVLSSTGSGSDYSNLKYIEEDYPTIEKDSDMCIVKVKASGLNFAELMQRQGLYKPTNKTPYTPGFEGAGILEECGDKVTDLKVNDRVMYFGGSGSWKDVVCMPRAHLVKIPDMMTFEQAAGIFVNYLTAYQILFRNANIQEGDSVLIHMAAGGVGTAATQLCRTIPGVVIFGTASASKQEYLKANGVDHFIDYTSVDYLDEVRKISPEGVDIVMDPLNGEHSIKGYELLKPMGRIVHFGVASMTSENRSLVNAFKAWWKCLSLTSIDIMAENKSISGYHLGYLLNSPSAVEKCMMDLTKIIKMFEEGKLAVKVDSFFTYSKVGEAMRRMHARKNAGKIILIPDCEVESASTDVAAQINATIPVIAVKADEEKTKTLKKSDTLKKEKKAKKEAGVPTSPETPVPNKESDETADTSKLEETPQAEKPKETIETPTPTIQ